MNRTWKGTQEGLRWGWTRAAAALALVLLVGRVPQGLGVTLDSRPAADLSAEWVDLGPFSLTFEDDTGLLTPGEVQAGAGQGAAVPGSTMNSIGFLKTTHWFVIPVENPTAAPLTRLLVAEPAWLDEVGVAVASSAGILDAREGGNHLPFGARSLPHPKPNFELQLPPGRSTLLVRVRSCGPTAVTLNLWERSAFFRAQVGGAMYEGITYGAIMALLLLNIVLYRFMREKLFGAYAIYLGAFSIMHAVYDGYAYQYLWPGQAAWNSWLNSAMVYLTAASGIHLAMVFLGPGTRHRVLYRWSSGLIVAILATLLMGTAYNGLQSDFLWFLWATVGPLFTLAVVLTILRDGDFAARYYLAGMAVWLAGSVTTALTVAGLLPYSFYFYEAVEIGMVAGMVLLAIAIARRVHGERTTAEAARAEVLAATTAHAAQLAEEVECRTRELRRTTAAKDKFLSIIAHDLRGPIHSLGVLYNDVVRSTKDFSDEVLALTRATTNSTITLLEHLLIWARSQRGEIDCRPEVIDIGVLLCETKVLYAAEASTKGVALELQVPGKCEVWADMEMVRTILRNLVNNAIKFTPAGGAILASVAPFGDFQEIRIADTGCGMDRTELQSLFCLEGAHPAKGAGKGVRGTGLGLLLCREFVECSGGAIRVKSRRGKGTTVIFTLPAAPARETLPPAIARAQAACAARGDAERNA